MIEKNKAMVEKDNHQIQEIDEGENNAIAQLDSSENVTKEEINSLDEELNQEEKEKLIAVDIEETKAQ